MSRRAVDQIAKSRDAEGRQVIWEAIRARNGAEFSTADLFKETCINQHTLRSYLGCLHAGGILERLESSGGVGRQPAVAWRLMRDEGFYAPRLNRKGQPVTQGLGVEQMWRAMRIMKEFTPRDLALHATTEHVSVTAATTKAYCTMLLACGYLKCIQQANYQRQATYRLIRNSGPLAPQIQRVKQVFDPNSKTVYCKGEA